MRGPKKPARKIIEMLLACSRRTVERLIPRKQRACHAATGPIDNLNGNRLTWRQVRKPVLAHDFHMKENILRAAKSIGKTKPFGFVEPFYPRRFKWHTRHIWQSNRIFISLYGFICFDGCMDFKNLRGLPSTIGFLDFEYNFSAFGNRTPPEIA